jgi:hypothetical protein
MKGGVLNYDQHRSWLPEIEAGDHPGTGAFLPSNMFGEVDWPANSADGIK